MKSGFVVKLIKVQLSLEVNGTRTTTICENRRKTHNKFKVLLKNEYSSWEARCRYGYGRVRKPHYLPLIRPDTETAAVLALERTVHISGKAAPPIFKRAA